MLNTRFFTFPRLSKGAFIFTLLAASCLVKAPSFAHTPMEPIWVASYTDEPRRDDDIYLVIKPSLSKELLNNAVSTLKTKGITLTYANEVYKDGKLEAITVTIEVERPGKDKATYQLSETSHDQAFKPMIFYYESAGQKVGFVQEAPAGLSHRGQLVVTNNLVGMAILTGDNLILHGNLTTTWK